VENLPEGHSTAAHSRLGTLLPLVRSVVRAFLALAVVMIGLSAFGVDIGPLLAGAGVVGIAIGFGAQSLVRDIFSGVFFLLDDAFRVGEYIEIESLRGTVENISIRSMRLRHHRGAVHTIPFGEVRSITNYSRDWVVVKLEFRIPFDTDLALVKRLVKQIGRELLDDPLLGPNLLEPLKSQGVRRVEEFNAVLGVKFMAKPGEQFIIRREAYQRILAVFEENGIQLASRSVRVEQPSARDGEALVAAQALDAALDAGGRGQ
jgi:small-conductance mechanosensitive channel